MITNFKIFEEIGESVICLDAENGWEFTIGKTYKIINPTPQWADIIDDIGQTIRIWDITISEPAHDKPSFKLYCCDRNRNEFGYPATQETLKEYNLLKGRRKSTKQFDL